MTKLTRIILVLLVSTQQIYAQGKLFIIGGGKRPPALITRMVEAADLQKEDYIIVLPMSSANPDTAFYYSNMQFEKAGFFNSKNFFFNNENHPSDEQLDSVRQARLIYIPGGSQSRFMNATLSNGISEAIKDAFANGAMIAGTSAGAAVMSEKMITGNQLRHPDYKSTFSSIENQNLELKPGLGLISSAIIDQHFIKRSRYNRLITASLEHQGLIGIGIDESTAILVQGNTAEVVGQSQVILFRNLGTSQVNNDGRMGSDNVLLSIYLPGEKFNINSQLD